MKSENKEYHFFPPLSTVYGFVHVLKEKCEFKWNLFVLIQGKDNVCIVSLISWWMKHYSSSCWKSRIKYIYDQNIYFCENNKSVFKLEIFLCFFMMFTFS